MAAALGHEIPRKLSIGLLFVTCLLVAALLAAEAHRAVTYHRRTAEAVLRDYASLAADEMIRRSATDLGYRGCYTLIGALAREAGQPGGLGNDPTTRLARADPATPIEALALLGSVFQWQAGRLEWMGPAQPDDVQSWLSGRLAAAASSPSGQDAYAAIQGTVAGEPRTFVYSRRADGTLFGFELPLSRVGERLHSVFDGAPLLPASLGHGRVANAAVSVIVSDHGGVERFRSQAQEWPALGVERPFGDAYAGVLRGSTVRVSIDPAAAGDLVIGGLPRSRLPLLFALLVLAALLLFVAARQLQRERALARVRTEFVANVSHELRTPLTQIRMFTETLRLDRVRSPEEQRRSLEILDKEARRLTHLVENALQFSRSERDKVLLEITQQDLAALAHDVVQDFLPLLAGSGVTVRTRLEPGVRASVDAGALRQVLLNLLDNAVKYGPRGQEVQVDLVARDGKARVTVTDQGPGIPRQERERVFHRFERLEREQRRAVAGAGIGLAVVRDLVVRQGGRCFVEDPEGGGARFVVELPLVAGDGAQGSRT
jgi:signal transduction histidine kinase